MAKRPVFITSDSPPFCTEMQTDFEYHNGFATVQKQKSIKSLHEAFLSQHPDSKILEISSKSEIELGVSLSAFNLMIETNDHKKYSVEVAFQASKVFEKGGPYKDILTMTSREAKNDPRLKNSGRLSCFYCGNRKFELNPTTFFYNWLYVNTLCLHPELTEQLVAYDAFTDIAFNPEKSINCQARSAAVYVSLFRQGLLAEAVKDKDSFLDVVYRPNNQQNTTMPEQLNLWEKL